PSFEEHPGKPAVVFCGRDQSYCARKVGPGKGDYLEIGLYESLIRDLIDRSQPLIAILRQNKEGILHAKRIEDSLLQEHIERLPGGDFHDSRQNVYTGLRAITPACSRLEVQRYGRPAGNVVGQGLPWRQGPWHFRSMPRSHPPAAQSGG